MDFPDNIEALGKAAQTFVMLHGAMLSEDTRERVIAALGAPSPVDRIVKTGEALYAVSGDLNDEGKTLVAQLISFATMNGWHGLPQDNRGGRIVMAMRRDIGEDAPDTMPWPTADTDPVPLAEFAPQVAEDAAIASPEIEPTRALSSGE